MADYLTTDTELTSIAEAIRTKGGTSKELTYPTEFVSAINAIRTGTYVTDTAATVTSGTASITSLNKTYNSTSGKFDITGSANVSAPTVGTAGYISSSDGTKNAKTGGATVSATIDKIVGTASISATTKKPSITKQNVPSGVTQAASGNATTTAPSSGVYVAVKSDANTATLTPSVSITTAGYGDTTNHGITANGATVGAAASDTTYVPITTTSASVNGKTVSYGSGWISAGSKSVADGAYSASVSAHSISTTPVVTGSISGTGTNIGTTTKPSGTDGTDYWTYTPGGSVTITGVSSAKGKATISTAGYIPTGNNESSASTVNITPTVNNGTARYLTKAGISWSGGGLSNTTNYSGTPTVSLGIDSQSTSGIGITDTTQDSGYYVKLTGSTAQLTGTTKVTRADYKETRTAGYLPARAETTILASTTSSPSVTVNAASKTRYLTLPTATFANSGTSGTTYTDISSSGPVLVAGDYLYINKGWTPDCKISLAKLVPDGSDVKGHGEYIISGHSAYDNDGTLVAGTIPTLASSDISVNGATVTVPVGKYTGASGATAVTKTIDSGTVSTTFAADGMSTYFNAGTSSDKNVTITPKYTNTAGYVAAHSTATNNGGTTYYKIKAVSGSIGGSASGGSATAAISNVNSMTTISDVTGKTAGTDYWTVKATATGSAGSYTPKYTVSTAGWIGSTVTGAAQSVSVSSDSTGKSINIPKATFDKSGNGVYCKTAGYIPAGTASSPVATVDNGTVVASVSSNSNGSASMAATGFTAASSTTTHYVTLSTSPGSVKAKATGGTAGYVTSSTFNETAATNVNVTGNGNKLYIPDGDVTASVSSNTAGSATMSASGFTSSSSATDYYVNLTTVAGSVKAKAVGRTPGYITASTTNETSATNVNVTGNGTKLYIPVGSASSNLTYSGATISTTNNSGVSVTPRHSVSKGYIPDATNVNGTTQYINGVTITAPSSGTRSFSITVPNGSSDTITFVFNVDSSGNVTVTNP